MAKQKNFYIGKGFTDMYNKGMEQRGVAIESIVYPKIEKGTLIHGYNTHCVIEQNGTVLGRNKEYKTSSWVDPIETIAPGIKASFFGLGAYKNVTITGINICGFSINATASAKSSNGINCTFNDKMSVYIKTVDMVKFRNWMKEWGHKFGLKRNGNVWIKNDEWKIFITKAVFPFCLETAVKKLRVNATSTFAMNRNNAKTVYEEVKEMMINYLSKNVGITASVYFSI